MATLLIEGDPGAIRCLWAELDERNYLHGEFAVDEVEWNALAALDLLAACEKLMETAYFQPAHPDQWACRVCHHWHWKQKDIIHSDWCAVPQAEAAIAKAGGEMAT